MAAHLTVDSVAAFIARILPAVADETGLALLDPACDLPDDLPEVADLCTACRIHAETFGDDGVRPFYVALADALGCRPVTAFHAVPGIDGPWCVGDGCDLWSAPCEVIARMVAAAIEPLTDSTVFEIEAPSTPSTPSTPSAPSAPSAPSIPSAPVVGVRARLAGWLAGWLPSAPSVAPSHRVQRYRGCRAGWQPIGRPRSADDAARLRALLQRIAPSATLRISSAA